jgi:hypothetical protein
MEAALRTRPKTAETTLPAPLRDRLARIVWLAARSHGLRLDDVLEDADPAAVHARHVAIALCHDLMKAEPRVLARYFGTSESAVRRASRSIVERAAQDAEFRTTLNFLKTSCAGMLR